MFKSSKMKSNKSGFTLIEVVLVLAIGGLIFLLAFLAFGQATKNRRDTQRRSDGARVVSEIENSKGDSGGSSFSSAATLGAFAQDYLGGTSSPTGGSFTSNNITYTFNYGTSVPGTAVTSSTGYLTTQQNTKCSGNTLTTGSGNGDYGVLVKLEKGVACRDNQ